MGRAFRYCIIRNLGNHATKVAVAGEGMPRHSQDDKLLEKRKGRKAVEDFMMTALSAILAIEI